MRFPVLRQGRSRGAAHAPHRARVPPRPPWLTSWRSKRPASFRVTCGASRESFSREWSFRCSAAGITPIAAGTKFTGVQYGTDLTPGAKWSWTWAATGISAKYQYRVVGKESVTVPAGTFEAVRVDYTAVVTSETRGVRPTLHGTLWIVSGVGLVKQLGPGDVSPGLWQAVRQVAVPLAEERGEHGRAQTL